MPFSVSCDACGATFKLSEDIYERRVAGKVVSVRCKKCKAQIIVDGTKPRTDLPDTAPSAEARALPQIEEAEPEPAPAEPTPPDPEPAPELPKPEVLPPVVTPEVEPPKPEPEISPPEPAPEVIPPEPKPEIAPPAPGPEPDPVRAESSGARDVEAAKPVALELRPKLASHPKLEPRPPLQALGKLEPRVQSQAAAKLEASPQAAPRANLDSRPKLESSPGVQIRPKLESSPGVQIRPKFGSSPEVQIRPKLESSPRLQTRSAADRTAARAKLGSSPDVKPLGGQPKAEQTARGSLGASVDASSLLMASWTPDAQVPEDEALTRPLPQVAKASDEDAATVPLPPVVTRVQPFRSRMPTVPLFRASGAGTHPKLAENLWAVSYSDEDDRELTTEQLIAELQRGVLDADTLVWRQSMPAWCALGEVPELATHLPWRAGRPPTKTSGFQVAEPQRGFLPPTTYYPPPAEEHVEPSESATSAAQSSVAQVPEQPRPAERLQGPSAFPVAAAASATLAAGLPAHSPQVAAAAQPARAEQSAPGQISPGVSNKPTSSQFVARLDAFSIPPKFRRGPGRVVLVVIAVIAVALGLFWVLANGAESDTSKAVSSPPLPKSGAAVAEQRSKDDGEQSPQKKPIDPYAAPAAGATESAPAGSAEGDFFELFASGQANKRGSERGGTRPFDKAYADKVLSSLAARASNCRKGGEPPGMASVVVKIQPSGLIKDARVIGKPYAGTPTARCLTTRFVGARIRAFQGEAQTLAKSVMLY